VFLTPWFLGMAAFFVGPLGLLAIMSFTDWSLLTDPSFVGLENYQRMFGEDYRFWLSIRITVLYLLMSVPIYLACGLGAALLLNQKVWGIRMFRTILFMPSVLSGVAVAVLWLQLLNPNNGAINSLLRGVGISNPPGWFTDPSWAVQGLVLTGLWGILGNGAIIYLAGLQNITPSLYESASLDGAGAWRRFWSITLPMLTPTLFFMLLTSVIGAFQVFDTAFTITGGNQGGGGDSLLFYLVYVFRAGFRDGELGYAAALSWVLVLVGSLVVIALMRTSNRWVFYDDDGRV
jgi:multiple sugar transport system permease protein